VPGRRPPEAVQAYIDPLQLAISCISRNAVLMVAGGYHPSDKPHSLTLAPPGPIQLHRRDHGEDLRFDVAQQYEIVPREGGGYRVRTLQYSYAVDDFETGKEILAYHWHPGPNEQVKFPHLHVSDGAQIGMKVLQAAHLPTGWIALEDVIKLLIESFHVVHTRDDWAELLEQGRQLFRTHSTRR
jgi:hypothetical protein